MNRFALSATGLLVLRRPRLEELNVTLDYWAGEAGITIANSSGMLPAFGTVHLSAVGMSFSIAANAVIDFLEWLQHDTRR